MHSTATSGSAARKRGLAVLAAAGALGLVVVGAPVVADGAARFTPPPLKVTVLTPGPGDQAGAGGTFDVDVKLSARNQGANHFLSAAAGYKPFFNDPNSATFHPGPAPAAPGLVVLLSTTPTIAGTPLQGPNTNLAGVFQLTDVIRSHGLDQVVSDWQVGVPGFFGVNKRAVLTVYAVKGTAPAVVSDSDPAPISNVVRVPFTIAP